MQQNTPTTDQTQHDYAGFWVRYAAYLVDSIILGILSSSLSFLFFSAKFEDGDFRINYLPGILISFAYYAFFWVKQNGQTIGKRAMRIRVISQDGGTIDWSTAIVRYLGYLLSGAVLFLGYISIGFNKKKLGWHDRLAKTYVVKVGPTRKWLVVLSIVLVTLFVLIFIGGIATAILLGLKGYQNFNIPDVSDFITPTPYLPRTL